MYRLFRMRRHNPKSVTDKFDYLFPQAITTNILRNENGGVLESDLLRYDRHLEDRTLHINRALSSGSARALSVRLKKTVLVDGFPLLITLHTGLEADPKLSFNGGEFYPIVNASGEKIPGGQVEGSIIFVVWSEKDECWYLMSDMHSEKTKVVLPVESEYVYTAHSTGETIIVIPDFDKKSCQLTVNYGQTVLRRDIDYRYLYDANNAIELIDFELAKDDQLYFTIISYITTAKHGHYRYELKDVDIPVTAQEDDTTTFQLPAEAVDSHSVVVNYNQTILRNGLDYDYNDTHTAITLKDFSLPKDDQLVFRITKFYELPGELTPNNWGSTGTYRYKVKVIHGSYTADENDTHIFPVPEFNPKSDDIAVIYDNCLYVLGVDYDIDEIGNVVLLNAGLSRDETIYFTILKGAMVDVPNFNTMRLTGQSGQHLHLDISYDMLTDFFTCLVQLNNDLETNPTIKCVDGPAEPLVSCYGEPIIGGYKAGSYMWIVYNENDHVWYSLSHSQLDISKIVPTNITYHGEANFIGQYDAAEGSQPVETVIHHELGKTPSNIVIAPCEPPIDVDGNPCTIGDIWYYADENNLYVGNTGNAVSKFKWTISTEDNTNDLRTYLENEISTFKGRAGNIITKVSTFTALEDGISVINTPSDFNPTLDKLIINYNQTVLRKNIDYSIDEYGKIHLTAFTLARNDILQFTVLKQEEDV